MYSEGSRFSHGTAARNALKFLSIRHITCGNHATPPSVNNTFNFGNFSNTPSATMLIKCDMHVTGTPVCHSKYVEGCPIGVDDLYDPSAPTCMQKIRSISTHASYTGK